MPMSGKSGNLGWEKTWLAIFVPNHGTGKNRTKRGRLVAGRPPLVQPNSAHIFNLSKLVLFAYTLRRRSGIRGGNVPFSLSHARAILFRAILLTLLARIRFITSAAFVLLLMPLLHNIFDELGSSDPRKSRLG